MPEEKVFLNSQVWGLFVLICGLVFWFFGFFLFRGFVWFVVVAGICYLLIFSLSYPLISGHFLGKVLFFPSKVCHFISVA